MIGKLVRAFKKRLWSKNFTHAIHTLSVMEILMKRCHVEFQLAMADSNMMMTLKILVEKSNRQGVKWLEVKQRILKLIKSWSEVYETRLHIGGIFVETYRALLKEGKVIHVFKSNKSLLKYYSLENFENDRDLVQMETSRITHQFSIHRIVLTIKAGRGLYQNLQISSN